jgi:hypothetical protein
MMLIHHDVKNITDVDNAGDERVKTRHTCKQQEIAVVSLANAVAYPWTVMVVHFDASTTVSTVECSRWSVNFASSAHFNWNFVPFDLHK